MVEEYKDGKVIMIVVIHSLDASLAIMNAVDIAFNGINKKSNSKKFLMTAFVFASPKVGDLNFQKASFKLKNLHVLRVHNLLGILLKYPPIGYFDIGQEIVIETTKSPYLKLNLGDPHTRHDLESYLHGIDGTQGIRPLTGVVLFSKAKLSLLDSNDWRNIWSSEDWLRVLKLLRLTVNTKLLSTVITEIAGLLRLLRLTVNTEVAEVTEH
ncbi:hypothetical protein BC332_30457 [Capsicum chinense]|nr:hypothetical protein BC332_30457 [Capsicum chinense]